MTRHGVRLVSVQNSIALPRSDMPRWQDFAKRLSRLARGDADDVQLGNVFLTLALVEKQDFDADALTALDGEWRVLFRGGADEREAA